MINPEELRKLQAARSEASAAYSRFEQQIAEEARLAADAVKAKYRDDLSVLSRAQGAAAEALRQYVNANAEHPLDGKIVYYDAPVFSRWSSRQQGVERRRGKVEVVRLDSEFPANMRYSRPDLGRVIVRKLKADGSPSLQFWDSNKLPLDQAIVEEEG